MADHLPAGGLPRSPDDAPDPSQDSREGDDAPDSRTAAGELIAEAFPHLDPDAVARALRLHLRTTQDDHERRTR